MLVSSVPVESIAQAIHERWRQEAIANGESAPTWQELDKSRQESSRDQARHIPIHLRKVGCALAPLGVREADFTFTDPEIKLLAIAEHERWKETPYLLPWEQLNERYPDIAELDAAFIRAMPAILASAALQIIRNPGEAEPSA